MYNYCNPVEHLKPEEIIVYLRKSRTDDPVLTVEEVLAKHEAALDEWAVRNLGATIPEENKYREVVSGETIADRPEVQKVLKLIESPKIKAILIVEVERISRGDLEDAGRLIKLFRYTNTLIITPDRTYDLTNEDDRDRFERKLKSGNEYLEYQKKIMGRGKELSVSQGNYIASIAPYGYDKIVIQEGKRKCPTLTINEEQANVVRMIFDLYVNQNMGYKSICNHLNDLHIPPLRGKMWTPITILCILKNVHYTGRVKYYERKTVIVVEDGEVRKTKPYANKGEYLIFEGKHPAIISDDLFNAAQEKLGKNPRAKADRPLQNCLAGLLYCRCGYAMLMRKYIKPNGEERNSPRMICTYHTHCHTASCTQQEILDFIENLLKQRIAEFDVEIQNNAGDTRTLYENRIKTLEKKLEDINSKELSLWESQIDTNTKMPPHIFKSLTEKLVKEREETELAIKEAYNTMPVKVDYQKHRVTFQKALDALNDESVSELEKNALLKECIKRIDYSRERPDNPNRWNGLPIKLDVTLMV